MLIQVFSTNNLAEIIAAITIIIGHIILFGVLLFWMFAFIKNTIREAITNTPNEIKTRFGFRYYLWNIYCEFKRLY